MGRSTAFAFEALVVLVWLAGGDARPADAAIGSAFNYQGQLKEGNLPVNDTCDMRFLLRTDPVATDNTGVVGTIVFDGSDPNLPPVTIENGLFNVVLDFGAGALGQAPLWLDVGIRCPAGSTGAYVGMLPRQPLTASPFAVYTRGLHVDGSGRVGIGTDSPKQSLHNAGDYYGKGHLWLYAYQGDGQDGTAYVQARDDSGTSSIGLKLRTQSAGSFVDALSIAPTGGVGVGITAPPQGLWVRAPGVPGFGGQFVIDSSDTSGDQDSGASILFTNIAVSPGAHLGALGCFKEDGDPTHGAYYLSLATKAVNNPPVERVRITSTGDVGIGTTDPQAALHVGRVGKWNWTSGNGWGDFFVGNGAAGLAIGVATAGGGAGDVRLWTRGGTERLFVGNPTDGVTVTIDDGEVGIGTTAPSRRLDVVSTGETAGISDWAAHFKDTNGTGEAWLAGDDGYGRDYGIETRGNKAGAFFHDTEAKAEARVAYTTSTGAKYGIWALGANAGGYFENKTYDSHAYLAFGETGIDASGRFRGGYFQDTNDGTTASLAEGVFSIFGNGVKAFVQNHPYDKKRVIVYAAPEGDEVATYTRGKGRLVNGVAHVTLGETFQWVTNPDIGLTAHLTPCGNCNGLYVASVSTTELVVRELNGGTSDVTFDYLVYGLRIGFEETAVVQNKRREANIPSMASQRALYEKNPELRAFNALERFRRMRESVGGTRAFNATASQALHDAVGEFDPAGRQRGQREMSTVEDTPPIERRSEPETTNDTLVAEATANIPDAGKSKDGEIQQLRTRLDDLEAIVAALTAKKEGGEAR